MDMNADVAVRERAYHIWQAEGCKDGWAFDHWTRAEREIAAPADRVAAAVEPTKAAKPAKPVSAKKPAVRKASAKG